MKRIYLDVPFEDREEAQAAGAVFCWKERVYYVGKDADRERLRKWEFDGIPVTERNAVAAFKAALLDAHLVIEGEPIMDGKWHTTTVTTSKSVNALKGAYKANITKSGANGYINNKDTGFGEGWKFDKKFTNPKLIELCAKNGSLFQDQLTPAQAEAVRPTPIDFERQRKEQEALYKEVSRRVTYHMNSLQAASADNEYLQKKGVGAYGVLDFKGLLAMPLRDIDGTIWSAQFISPTAKNLSKDGKKSGCFHLIGDIHSATTILICEGYATGASLHEATQLPVAVAVDSLNLKNVLISLSNKHPDKDFVVCGDDDRINEKRVINTFNASKLRKTMGLGELERDTLPPEDFQVRVDGGFFIWKLETSPAGFDRVVMTFGTDDGKPQTLLLNNVGREKAVDAAIEVNAKCVFPNFADSGSRYTDFNDLHQTEGLLAVKKQIAAVIDVDRSLRAIEVWAMVNGFQAVDNATTGSGAIIQNTGVHLVQQRGRGLVGTIAADRLDRIPVAGEHVTLAEKSGAIIIQQKINKVNEKGR